MSIKKTQKESIKIWNKTVSYIHTIAHTLRKNIFVCASMMVAWSLLVASWFVSAQFFWGNSDFLEQVFSPSKSQQQVINIGNDKQAVGNEVFRPSLTIQWWSDGVQTITREPLLVRLTKFILRLTIVLSVTMVIYSGIRYMTSVWSEESAQKTRQNLLYIVLWILLAMMSYGIIILLQSITFSTLSTF